MNDGYLWWLILVGAVIMLAVIAVFAVRLPRSEQDVADDERRAEAAWISGTIERFGGVAPTDLVEEVLELHAEYLGSPRLARIPDRTEVGRPALPPPSPPAGPAPLPPPGAPPPTLSPHTVSGGSLPPAVTPPPPLGRPDRTPPRGR